MLTSPNNFCSAPILRSHFVSTDESSLAAMTTGGSGFGNTQASPIARLLIFPHRAAR